MSPTKYEQFVARLVALLSANDLITPPGVLHKKKYTGRSGEEYEIDVSYTFSVANANYLTLVECKKWNSNVERTIVSAFKTVLDDIGAHKGIIVTTKGFQSGAIGAAEAYGIGLFKLSTTGHLNIVKNFTGDSAWTMKFLSEEDVYEERSEIKTAAGLSYMSVHVLDYIALRYGREIAAYLNTEEAKSVNQIANVDIRDAVVSQLKMMGDNWIDEYLEIESCGMPLIVEPHMYLRLINMKAYIAMLELDLGR
jgi:hypothetical protein